MRYVLAGSSGLLGTALRDALAREGHEVTRLVRSESPSVHDSRWDPYAGQVDREVLQGADVVVNLAGTSQTRLLTSAQRRLFRDSRVATTGTLARAIADLDGDRPALLAQSAIAAYGSDRGDTVLDETVAGRGGSFLHDVVQEWEAATEPAERAGVRVCHLRTGIVLDRRGGAMQAMLPVFRLGLGGRLGDGTQYFSTISMHDWVAAVLFLGSATLLSGDFNLSGPLPATNAEFTVALGRAVHRPTRLTVPAPVLRRLLGQFSGDVLGSLRVVPAALEAAGFEFRDRTVDAIIAAGLG